MNPEEILKLIEDECEQAIKRGGENYADHYMEGLRDGMRLVNPELYKKVTELVKAKV